MERLEALGATVTSLPAIEFEPVEDHSRLDSALDNFAVNDVVIFTSVTGVEFVSKRFEELGLAAPDGDKPTLAVIGPATGAAVEKWWRMPDVMPSEFRAEAIAEALGDVRGKRILMLRADLARPELRLILEASGAHVEEVAAYRILPANSEDIAWPDVKPDVITLTSAASARLFVEAAIGNGHSSWLDSSDLVCIGPITRDAVLELGYAVAATASEYTEAGLVQAILDLEAAHA